MGRGFSVLPPPLGPPEPPETVQPRGGEVGVVLEVLPPDGFGSSAGGGLVVVGGDSLAESCVGPVDVVLLAEVIEGALLAPHGPLRWHGRLLLEGQMHALVASVLLRLAGSDPFVADRPVAPTRRTAARGPAVRLRQRATPLSERMASG